jgi:hypothetical protein
MILGRLIPQWENTVANTYNQWKLVPENLDGCCECKDGIKLDFQVEFGLQRNWPNDFVVKINWETYESDMLNWGLKNVSYFYAPFGVVAHEIGHMYGLLDGIVYPDYPGREIHPDDIKSIMGIGSGIFPHHIERIVHVIAEVNEYLPCKVKEKVAPR